MMQPHLYDSRDVHLRYAEARRLPAETIALWMSSLRRHLPDRKLEGIVDLGCGTGRFSCALADSIGAPVYAIDPSAKMLSVARGLIHDSQVHLVRAAAEALPLADASVELVFMSMVYHHLVDRPAALREIRRLLVPGGHFALRICSLENLDSFLYQCFFPQARAIDIKRLEPRGRVIDSVTHSGFRLTANEMIEQVAAETADAYVHKIEMRGSSDLEAISDDEFATGLARLRDHVGGRDRSEPVREQLDLLVFRKDGGHGG